MNIIKKNFSQSAQFYDYFYKNKNYLKETKYILNFLPKKKQDILEYGCGTGSYSIFLSKTNNKVLGIDKSRDMILKAKNKVKEKRIKNIKFKVFDIVNYRSKKKFDVCFMMFNVVNYIISSKELKKLFNNIYYNLKRDGLVIFDQWKSSNINKNNTKIRKIKIKDKIVVRKGTTVNMKSDKFIRVDYEYFIKDFYNNNINNFKESHFLKIYNLKIIKLSIKNKFRILKYLKWMDNKTLPTRNDNQSFIVAKKINS